MSEKKIAVVTDSCTDVPKELLERYGVRHAVYAHLHGRAHRAAYTGEKNGVQYTFAAADYLEFVPKQIV